MKTAAVLLTTLFLGLTSFTTIAHADATSDLANAKCVKCHNRPDFPALGGQLASYIFSTMKDYQNGRRHSHDAVWYMSRRVNFDDKTLQALALYFSKMPPGTPIEGDPTLSAKGKDIYENGIEAKGVEDCASCHGDNGEGMGKFPRLAGLHDYYLIDQMKNYKHGLIDKQKAMTEACAKLNDEEMLALATYLQSK